MSGKGSQKSEVRSQKSATSKATSNAITPPAETTVAKAAPTLATRRVAFSNDPGFGEPPTGLVQIGMRKIELPADVESLREGFELEAGDARALVRSVAGFKYLERKGAK